MLPKVLTSLATNIRELAICRWNCLGLARMDPRHIYKSLDQNLRNYRSLYAFCFGCFDVAHCFHIDISPHVKGRHLAAPCADRSGTGMKVCSRIPAAQHQTFSGADGRTRRVPTHSYSRRALMTPMGWRFPSAVTSATTRACCLNTPLPVKLIFLSSTTAGGTLQVSHDKGVSYINTSRMCPLAKHLIHN